MPAPYPIELRERAVRAYESGNDSYDVVAERFSVASRALQRWVKLRRDTGNVAPMPRGGGNPSPIDLPVLEAVIAERGDATSFELTAEYNRRVLRKQRVHRSSVHRALLRAGYVFKKNSYVRRSRRGPMSNRNERVSSGA
jgi:transposase